MHTSGALLLALLPAISAFMPAPLSSSQMKSSSTQRVAAMPVVTMSGGEAEWVLRTKEIPKKEEWVPVLKATEIAPGDKIPVFIDDLTLLLVADDDGAIFCTAGNSPFMSAPLSEGTVRDGTISCPQSQSVFDLETGTLVSEWCPFPPVLGPLVLGKLYPPANLATFPLRSRGDSIEVFIDRNLKAQFEAKYWRGLLDANGKATGEYY